MRPYFSAMRSAFILSLTSYTPPGSGFRSPPLPTTADISERGIPDSAIPSRTAALRNSSWSWILRKRARSSDLCETDFFHASWASR